MKPLLKWTATGAACLAVIGAVMVVWPGTVSLPASEPAVTVSAPVDSPADDTVSGSGDTDTSGTGVTDPFGTGGTSTDTSGGTDSSGSGGAPASAPGDTYVESGSGGTSASGSGGTYVESGSGGTGSDDTYAETQYSHDDHDHGTPVHPAEPEHGAGHH